MIFISFCKRSVSGSRWCKAYVGDGGTLDVNTGGVADGSSGLDGEREAEVADDAGEVAGDEDVARVEITMRDHRLQFAWQQYYSSAAIVHRSGIIYTCMM